MRRIHHFCQAAGGGDVAGMDETVEMTGRLFDLLTHVIIAVEVKDVSD